MTYGHLWTDCLYTGISSGPNARYRLWETFTFTWLHTVLLVRFCSAMPLQYSSTWRRLWCRHPAAATLITSCGTSEIHCMMLTILHRLNLVTSTVKVIYLFVGLCLCQHYFWNDCGRVSLGTTQMSSFKFKFNMKFVGHCFTHCTGVTNKHNQKVHSCAVSWLY